jgi:spermidine/putrescine transport system substrate-binding protein
MSRAWPRGGPRARRIACALAAALALGCEGAPERPAVVDAYGLRLETAELGEQLNLFIWPDYMDPELIEEFEAAYGVTVAIDYYDTNEAMIAKLQAGGTGQYDLVVASDYAVEVLRGESLLEPLDHALLPNLGNLAARFRDAPFDPGNVYTAMYQWGTSGLGIRSDLVEGGEPEASWRLVFDPAAQAGPFTMLNDPRETIGAALIYLGHSANSTDTEELAEAERLLVAQRDRVLTYAPFASARDLLASGDAVVAHNFSGDILMVAGEVPAVRYVIPSEGSVVWTDNLAVPAGAPNPRLAHAFINFILDAEVGARLSNWTRYASPNEAAMASLDPELLADPAVYPDSAVMARLEFLRDLGPARAEYDRIWTRLRTGAQAP